MEDFAKKFSLVGEQITSDIDLLEIVKGYCDYNFDKCRGLRTISSLVEIILKEQKVLAENFDNLI